MTHLLQLTSLATEAGGGDGLWDPTLRGLLVIFAAVTLFFGSIYLILYTNLGGVRGLLIATSALTGFLTLLGALWLTGTFPNGYLGRQPGWTINEIIENGSPADSSIEAVTTIENDDDLANVAEAGVIKASLDPFLTNGDAIEAAGFDFSAFASVTDYTYVDADSTYVVGGEIKNLFWHVPEYSAVHLCPVLSHDITPVEAPPPAECDPDQADFWIISTRDLGSIRQPAFFTMAGSLILFAISLWALHRNELADRETPVAA
ncbi:MAG: hypothetical protein H6512_12865 [Acidimicrobiia bacterium]|nr:hypothetical protein [Acidimicrobiia bacterium]